MEKGIMPYIIGVVIVTLFGFFWWMTHIENETRDRIRNRLNDCASKNGVIMQPKISVLTQGKGGLLKLDAYSDICVKVESIEVIP
jgi:hypothetical protein